MNSPSLIDPDFCAQPQAEKNVQSRPPSSNGQLSALRTKAEMQASFEITTAYIIEIPLKLAKKVLECVDKFEPIE